jgi:hypothetical protein
MDEQAASRNDAQGDGGGHWRGISEFMVMDKEEGGSAVGRFPRIKVRLDICKPLMRGVTVFVEKEGEDDKPIWCPLVYEYLLEFCYTCGRTGHIDKNSAEKLKQGENQQFGKFLRFIPEMKKVDDEFGDRFPTSRGPW